MQGGEEGRGEEREEREERRGEEGRGGRKKGSLIINIPPPAHTSTAHLFVCVYVCVCVLRGMVKGMNTL